jgi:hypothetical protein
MGERSKRIGPILQTKNVLKWKVVKELDHILGELRAPIPEGGELRSPIPEGGELRTPIPVGGELRSGKPEQRTP